MSDDAHECKTVRGIPFQPGHDPRRNPGGRYQVAKLADQMFSEASKEVMEVIIARAKAGDMVACKMISDRSFPAPKNRPVEFELPPSLKTPTDVADALDGLLRAAGEGSLTPDEASTLSGILETKRRALETVELADRLAVVEAGQKEARGK